MSEKYTTSSADIFDDARPTYNSGRPVRYDDEDVFGHEEGHDVHSTPHPHNCE